MSSLKLLGNFQKQAEKAGKSRKKPEKSEKNRQFADICRKSRKNQDVLEFGTKRPWGKDSMTASGGNFIESFLNR